MSVTNFHLGADRLMILTDSVVYAGKNPVAMHRKIDVNDEARLAVTVLGLVSIGNVYKRLLKQWGSRADAERSIEATAAHAPDDVFLRSDGTRKGYSVTLFGWDNGPFAVRWNHNPDGSVNRHDFAPGLYLAPTLGKQQYPATITPDQMRQVAELQQSVAIKHGLTMCIGGWMDLTTIDADGIRVERLADYPNRALTEARIAAHAEYNQGSKAA